MTKIDSLVKYILLAICTFAVLMGDCQEGNWIQLFDGKTLDGWSVHSGYAKYRVEDNAIVGSTEKGSPNTFLCTDRAFGDFILEFEVLVNPRLNSGVQFRSLIAGEELVYIFRGDDEGEIDERVIPTDRVYGYQVEIATAESGSCGGVYDEARRGFFLDLPDEGSEASKAFKDNQWNKYRIECKGNGIKTFVNGILCTDFKDSMTDRGIIGLQVHEIRGSATYEVRWRNIRIMPLD